MASLFNVKFYEHAMGSIFCCHLSRANSDASKLPHGRLGGATSYASENPSHQAYRKYLEIASERPVNATFLHYAAQSTYAPKPLHGWTSDEQLALIAAMKEVPSEHSIMVEHRGVTKETAHKMYLLLISKHVPSKSISECEECLKYLYAKRVVYFGQHHSCSHRG